MPRPRKRGTENNSSMISCIDRISTHTLKQQEATDSETLALDAVEDLLYTYIQRLHTG